MSRITNGKSNTSKPVSKTDIESFIYNWNIRYPIDRWWREKHKVSFNSPQHRVISFLDMFIEWAEDQLFEKEKTMAIKNATYVSGDWLKPREISFVDSDKDMEAFKNMDLSKLDDHGR